MSTKPHMLPQRVVIYTGPNRHGKPINIVYTTVYTEAQEGSARLDCEAKHGKTARVFNARAVAVRQ